MEKTKNIDKLLLKMKTPSIDIALDECRHLYQMEDSRQQTIESKTGILLGIIGIFIGIVVVFHSVTLNLLLIMSYIFSIISILFGIYIIKLERYTTPHKEYDGFFKYAKMDNDLIKKKILLQYIGALKNCKKLNDKKACKFRFSIITFLTSVIFFLSYVLFFT